MVARGVVNLGTGARVISSINYGTIVIRCPTVAIATTVDERWLLEVCWRPLLVVQFSPATPRCVRTPEVPSDPAAMWGFFCWWTDTRRTNWIPLVTDWSVRCAAAAVWRSWENCANFIHLTRWNWFTRTVVAILLYLKRGDVKRKSNSIKDWLQGLGGKLFHRAEGMIGAMPVSWKVGRNLWWRNVESRGKFWPSSKRALLCLKLSSV